MKEAKEQEEQQCEGCKSIEKEIYWNHIKNLCFCVSLPPNFHDKLQIPKKFAENMKPKMLQPKMVLRGPSGASWEVNLMISVDGLFLQHGWEDFVNAYSLQENDILLFKYDRNSSFDVKIFNGNCEKESAYFVKKCEHVSSAVKNQKKRIPIEIVNEDDEVRNCIATKKIRKDDGLRTYDVKTSKRVFSLRKSVQLAIHCLRKKAVSRSSFGGNALSVDQNPPHKLLNENGPPGFTTQVEYDLNRRPAAEIVDKDNDVCIATTNSDKDPGTEPVNERQQLNGLVSYQRKGAKKRSLVELLGGDSHVGPETDKAVPFVEQNSSEVTENSPLGSAAEKTSLPETRKEAATTSLMELQPIDSLADAEIAKQPDQDCSSTNKEVQQPSVDVRSPEFTEISPVDDGLQKDFLFFTRKKAESTSSTELQGKDSLAAPELAKQSDQNGSTEKDIPSVNKSPPHITEDSRAGLELDQTGSVHKKVRFVDQNPPESTENSPPDTKPAKQPDQNDLTNGYVKDIQPCVDQNPPKLTENSPPNSGTKKGSLLATRSTPRKGFRIREKTVVPAVEYVSNRRPVTVQEKQGALRRAVLELTNNSFFATVSSCNESFFMTIPNGFASVHLGLKDRDVILRVGDKEWETKFSSDEGGIRIGWKRFALDNNLEESDVCLFKLVSQENGETVKFDVDIFRVVEDVVTPPTLLIT